MNSINKVILLIVLVVCVFSFRHGDHFITLNTSGIKYYSSTSMATNLNEPFTIYCPLMFDNENSTVKFTPNQIAGQLEIAPTFSADSYRLYNEHNNGEFWYAFKKNFNPDAYDTSATFALAKITYEGNTQDYILPLFSLPLSLLNFEDLYKCDDVLISLKRTGPSIDVTVFSQRESWHLFPKANWGFRHQDETINFGRQTFPLGTEIEIDVGPNQYCVLKEDLPKNTYNLEEQNIYTLEDLLVKYSKSLSLKTKTI